MWLAGTPTRVIAETLKISADKCDAIRRKVGLPRRQSWHGSKAGHRKAYLPSEAEIRQKCLEFQAGWSDEERARRRVGWSPAPKSVEIRVIPESAFGWASNAHLSEEGGPGWSLEELTDLGTSGD
jgi:hypothetical protein